MDAPARTNEGGADPPLPPPRRRRRWLRYVLAAAALLVAALFVLPYSIGLARVQRRIEREVAARIGAPCEIGDMAFSWLDGVRVRDLVVGNPAGFTDERPALRAASATLDLRLLPLLFGDAAVTADVAGLEVFVEQHGDGTSNLQQLAVNARGERTAEPGQAPAPGEDQSSAFDVRIRDARIEIRRDGQLLETVEQLSLTADRSAGADRTRIAAEASLTGGRIDVALQHDAGDGALDANVATTGLELSRWQPLIDALMPERLTALAGRVEGQLEARYRRGDALQLGGELTVAEPRLAGPMLRGLDLRGERWRLAPNLSIGGTGGSPADAAVDASRFAVDLGFLQVNGRPPVGASGGGLHGDAGTNGGARRFVSFAYELDVAALANAGDLLPESLRGSDARVRGEVTLPASDLPADAAGWAAATTFRAEASATRIAVAGFEFRDVTADATLQDGTCTLVTGESTRLDGGALAATVRCDVAAFETMPVTATLRWQNGTLQGGTASALRYAMPLLAGDLAAAALSGTCDLELTLAGPGRKGEQVAWLAWLDGFRGSGVLRVADAAISPAPALRGLLSPLGPLPLPAPIAEGGKLAVDSFEAPFQFEAGAVRATAAKWLAKGSTIGLSGSVRLDGGIDYEIDLSGLLRGHSDGERVLQALDGALPPARLLGSLDAPRLALPEIESVLQRLLQGRIEEGGKDLLRRELDRLLRRGR